MNAKDRAMYADKAAEIWRLMDANERTGVRFGMFPDQRMQDAMRLGYVDGRLLCSELMACASADGGMRA